MKHGSAPLVPPVATPLRAAAALLALAFAGCGRPASSSDEAAAAPVVRVRTVAARSENIPVTVEATGTVRAVQRAALSPKIMGVIEELSVKLGQQVRKGDILARISAGEIAARVRQAQATLDGLRRDLAREQDLLAKGAAPRETVESLKDRIATAEATLKEAEVMLGYTEVRAPFDGAIGRRLAEAGDLATPGVPLLEIEGLGATEVQADIPETAATRLAVGHTVAVDAPSAGLTFAGRVSEVAATADPRSRTVTVKIDVPPDTAVRSGQFVRIQVPVTEAAAILVPAAAVAAVGQIERVFVAGADHRLSLRLVKTGPARAGDVEILAGLLAGERVVRSPAPGLHDGQRVEIEP